MARVINLRIALAQIDFCIGDVENMRARILVEIEAAKAMQADIVVFPELSLVGYPPQDLLWRPELSERISEALEKIAKVAVGIDVLIGYPERTTHGLYNAAVVLREQAVIAHYRKRRLPNQGVFDEQRYFQSGEKGVTFELKGIRCAIAICEDIWHPAPTLDWMGHNPQLIFSIHASPFDRNKLQRRAQVLQQRAQEYQAAIVYCNWCDAQEELIFDGGSCVVNTQGEKIFQAPFFETGLFLVNGVWNQNTFYLDQPRKITTPDILFLIYEALVLAVRQYVRKSHSQRVFIGLSGGIDSALTLAIAVAALGAESVTAVLMPSRYTQAMSVEDALLLAERLQVRTLTVSIEPVFQSLLEVLTPSFEEKPWDVTEENLQSRCRGVLLMALANKHHGFVLTTGNKSEIAVGYATLYGDTAGAFCVLKDVTKTWVYRLANYVNRISEIIPQRIIERAPSAELAENQTDQDSLPPYEVLDAILEAYIEQGLSLDAIVQLGFDAILVNEIVHKIHAAEFKRRQMPPGPRVSPGLFGKDWRYPLWV